MKPALPLLRNIIGRLRVRCDFIEEGCTEILDYEQLGNHIRSCPYGPMGCENEGCQTTFPRKDKNKHEAECPFRRMVCSQGCGLEYKLNEAVNHNCMKSLKSLVTDLQGKVSTLEQTVNELRQDIQELKNAQSKNTSTLEIRNTRNSGSSERTGPQDGDSGLISLLSEDEEESDNSPTWTPGSRFFQEVLPYNSPLANFVARELDGMLGLRPTNQLQLDRERRQSRTLRQSSPTRRERSRSRSPIGSNLLYRRNRENSLSEFGFRRRRSRMSASSTQTSSSASGSSSSTPGNSNSSGVHPRRRRQIRQINREDDSSSQADIEQNVISSSDESESEHHNTTEARDIATSPHLSPATGYSSSDDSYLHLADSDEWWQEIATTHSSNVNQITAHFQC